MTISFRRKAAAVTFAVLGLTLAGGGIAIAQPAAKAPEAVQPAARANGSQPPVSAESARVSRALTAKATTLAAATTLTVVNANGTKARGTGTVIKYGVGQYEVQFGYVVTGGVYVATIGRPDSCCVPPSGEVAVAPRLQTSNGVFVQTRNSAGVAADLPFHLVVHLS
ncbi:hypothetical protein ACFOOK_28910 [Micromonospora krabiensis]|uniref:Secreted protein n=1 Tax=Micromonospora krabiensis TaxID=307121 RepID=A0A1C3N4D4_9ACTN|nr:hypothetical protein [Micromonospora krabiensis]SBV27433.1 hypothetical protein GA0070620_2950 [Micromonospora krabiensis]